MGRASGGRREGQDTLCSEESIISRGGSSILVTKREREGRELIPSGRAGTQNSGQGRGTFLQVLAEYRAVVSQGQPERLAVGQTAEERLISDWRSRPAVTVAVCQIRRVRHIHGNLRKQIPDFNSKSKPPDPKEPSCSLQHKC